MRWLILGSVPIVLGMFFSFIGTALVARMVGPAVFGEYMFLLTWISVAALLAKSGHEWVLLKVIPGRLSIGALGQIRYVLKQAFFAVMVRAGAAAVLLGFFAAAGGYWADPVALSVGLTLVVVLSFAELRRSWALAHRAIWFADAPENIVKSLVLAGSVAGLLTLGVNVDASTILAFNLGITFFTTVVATLVFIRFACPGLLYAPSEPLPAELSETDGIVRAMFLTSLANISMRNLDLIVVGLIVDAATTGIYAAASRLSLLAAGPIMVLDRLVAPVMAKAAAEMNHTKLEETAKLFVLLAGAGAAVILIAFLVAGDSIITIAFGAGYRESLSIVLIIMLGNVLAALAGPAGVAMAVGGAHSECARINITTALLNLVLLAVLTPVYGVLGAAIATAMGVSSKALISAAVARRRLKINTTILLYWRSSQ